MDPLLPQRKRRLSKGLYIIPSMFTTANMALGYYAILEVMHATLADFWHLDNAAIAIGFAVLFDGLDGRIARMTGTTSDFGRELDSLADAITFGVAPAMLAWTWGFHLMPPVLLTQGQWHIKLTQLGAIASFLFLIAGASRFARFNITVESAAFKSRTARKEILRRNADSGGCRRDCRRRPLCRGGAPGVFVHSSRVVRDGHHGGLSHGEHVALLQFQRH